MTTYAQGKLFGPGKSRNTLPPPLEREEQKALFRWIEYVGRREYPLSALLFHVPNGGRREKREAKHLQEQGVRPGIPDLFLPVPLGGYHGLWIEMKRRRNKPNAEQTRWLTLLREQGYVVTVCERMEEARDVLIAYLKSEFYPTNLNTP